MKTNPSKNGHSIYREPLSKFSISAKMATKNTSDTSTRNMIVLFGGFTFVIWILLFVQYKQNVSDNYRQTLVREEVQRVLINVKQLAEFKRHTVKEFGQKLLKNCEKEREKYCSDEKDISCFKSCRDTEKKGQTLILYPYRDRYPQIKQTLQALNYHINRTTPNQCFKIMIVEQIGDFDFNKGRLMNAGFIIALEKLIPYMNCVIFHDSDLIPYESINSLKYECGKYPIHLSVSVDKLNYRLPYAGLIGGILAVPYESFILANGFSNLYWGWGGEDDDLYERFSAINIPVVRPDEKVAKYIMLKHRHARERVEEARRYLLNNAQARYHLDGLNSLNNSAYLIEHFPKGVSNKFAEIPINYDIYHVGVLIKDSDIYI